ncbi:MAG: NAD-dependent epimerase/dehydratase family protein [Bacteroidales bacterium]|nr:NAD-dependent epimerase/dehydratase family protein [Bacteroidales bacterium]
MDSTVENILIAGTHDFVSPYMFRAARDSFGEETQIWMLGDGPLAGIPVDLTSGSITLPAKMEYVIYTDATDSSQLAADKLMPMADNLIRSLEPHAPCAMIYISTVGVYGKTSGENVSEATAPAPLTDFDRAKLAVEKRLTEWCATHAVKLAILRPAPVVGTGMGGELRTMVNRIYRATYRHVIGDESRMSVVHATDLASAAVMLLGSEGIYNITDGIDPTRHDLAEALSSRLNRKRIYSLPAKRMKLIARIGDWLPITVYNTKRLQLQTSTLTYDSTKLREALPDWHPADVTDYLTSHVYDASSL